MVDAGISLESDRLRPISHNMILYYITIYIISEVPGDADAFFASSAAALAVRASLQRTGKANSRASTGLEG